MRQSWVVGQATMFAQRLGIRAIKQATGIANALGLSGDNKGDENDKK